MWSYRIFKPFFEIIQQKQFIWPSINHKDEHFAIFFVKIGWNIKGIYKKNLQKKRTRGSHYVAHLSFCFEETLYRTFHRCFLPNFGSFGYSWFRGGFSRNRPSRNKSCLRWPCLLSDQDEMNNLYRGPSIDASYQVSVHLANRFQRRRLKSEKLTDDRCQSFHCLWQGELTINSTHT